MTENFISLFCEYFKKDVCITSQNITFQIILKHYFSNHIKNIIFILKYKTVIYRVYKKYRDGEYLEN